MLASLWDLDTVIAALLTSRILVQFLAQILALQYMRKHRADIARPFRMWLYPLPGAIAFAGWSYIFLSSGWRYVAFGLLTLVAGAAAWWHMRASACTRRRQPPHSRTGAAVHSPYELTGEPAAAQSVHPACPQPQESSRIPLDSRQ